MNWKKWCLAGATAAGAAMSAWADNPGCVGATGACLEANGTPGCEIAACCKEVCLFDPGCCVVEWDAFCAEYAATLFACIAPPSGDALWDNGGLVTDPGAGAGGADVSRIGPGQTLFGWGIQAPTPNTLSDDFTVSAGGWNITGLEFFAYQTGSTTTSSMTGLFARIWSGTPGAKGSTVVWGDLSTNLLTTTGWTGIYRTSATDLQNTARPIMSVRAEGLDVLLNEGTYWIEWTATGSIASGPWQPPVSAPDEAVVGNALQFTNSSGTYNPAYTDGAAALLQGALPFKIYGTGSTSPCLSSNQSCTEAHGTPGCANAACCGTVCGALPECCSIGWDALCVNAAAELCGLYVCPSGSFPANNCPTGATVVQSGDVVAFNSTTASTTGPLQPQCGSTGGDAQIWKDLWYRISTTDAVRLTASTCGTANFDTKIAAYNIGDGTFNPETLSTRFVRCNEDGPDCPDSTSLLSFIALPNTTYLIRLGGFAGQSGSGTISFASDPLIPAQTCTSPGANPIDNLPTNSVASGGVACAAAGITTRNVYAVVFPASAVGGAYSFSCVNFGFTNSGSYLEGEVGVWVNSGTVPSINGMTPLATYPVGLYNGAAQFLTVTGDSVCVELEAGETLVVTLDIPASTDGFASYAGSIVESPNKTYVWSGGSCGFTDFTDLESVGAGFDNKWYVQLSGNIGCDSPTQCLGDLNADNVVNGADLGLLIGAWGTADPVADLNGDGTVNGADLGLLIGAWGACP